MYQRKTYMHIKFQQNRVSSLVKTVHTNLFSKKIANCIILQLAIRILKNHAFRTCTMSKHVHHVQTDIEADFGINWPIRRQITAKRNYLHRRTDRRCVRQQ